MEKFNYLLVIGCILKVVHLCYSSPAKCKQLSGSPIYNAKQAEYETEHYQAYSTNIDLYTNWPELKMSGKLNENTCKMYMQKLFANIDYKQCVLTPSMKKIRLSYLANISSSFGNLIGEPLIISFLCHVDQTPPSIHRKYFYFIRAPLPECVYLTNRRKRGSLEFYISLRVCKSDTYHQLKNSGLLEGAVNKQKWLPRKEPRDCDSIKDQEEYERSHQLWIDQISVRADTWPELAGENLRIFCGKLLKKLYPRTKITSENVDPVYAFKNLNYTKLRNSEGFEFPSLQVIVVCCETKKKKDRGGHIFIRAPNHGSLNCVYMIRAAKKRSRLYLQIIKRLCIQKLYVNEEQEGAVTNTIVNVQMNNENGSGPIITEGNCKDPSKPKPTKQEKDYIIRYEVELNT